MQLGDSRVCVPSTLKFLPINQLAIRTVGKRWCRGAGGSEADARPKAQSGGFMKLIWMVFFFT